MQRLIFLQQQYIDTTSEDKQSKKETSALQQKQFLQSVAAFKEQMSPLSKSFRITKQLQPEALLIEYGDDIADDMYKALISCDVVDIIDSIIPHNIDTISSSEELNGIACRQVDKTVDNSAEEVEALRNKMARYMK
jgi:hypothetical protein